MSFQLPCVIISYPIRGIIIKYIYIYIYILNRIAIITLLRKIYDNESGTDSR